MKNVLYFCILTFFCVSNGFGQTHLVSYVSDSVRSSVVDPLVKHVVKSDPAIPIPQKKESLGFHSSLQIDFIKNNFNQFAPVLESFNIDLMNQTVGVLDLELGGQYKRLYAGFNVGKAGNYDNTQDSLDVEFHVMQYAFTFEYTILQSRRFQLNAKADLKWRRYRLLNNDKERQISFPKYINDRDLDIRFNQTSSSLGLDFAYKMYRHSILFTDCWAVGCYGGYLVKITDRPWVYSSRNRLMSDYKIDVNNYNFGVYCAFYFQ